MAVPSTVTLPKYSTTPWSAGMAVRASTFPVAGFAQTSSCVPPIQTAPPLRVGSEARPPPAPWLTRNERDRSPPGANQTHSLIPDPGRAPDAARGRDQVPGTAAAIVDDAAHVRWRGRRSAAGRSPRAATPTYSLLPSGATATELAGPAVRKIRRITWPVAGSTTATVSPAAT